MLGSGTLGKLISKGFKYMFVSNSDNLGAVMDLKIHVHCAARQVMNGELFYEIMRKYGCMEFTTIVAA